MVALSLMPPVAYCTSYEGQKAESKARDIASDRETAAFGAARTGLKDQPSTGAPPPIATADAKPLPVDTVARTLLSPDLAVQASLAQAGSHLTDTGGNPTLRLQALQAYASAPLANPGL